MSQSIRVEMKEDSNGGNKWLFFELRRLLELRDISRCFCVINKSESVCGSHKINYWFRRANSGSREAESNDGVQ